MSLTLRRSAEPKIVFDHGVWPDRHLTRICQIELAKHDLVAPDLTNEIFKNLNSQLLTWTPSVSKAERSEAGIVANRKTFPTDNTENSAEAAVRDVGLASILNLEIRDLKWA